jgi:hypothetical protein
MPKIGAFLNHLLEELGGLGNYLLCWLLSEFSQGDEDHIITE